ncbi:AAA family ATPase [Candidatus Desantisbacteria bacterium]|nr:AAA family ATPase [Candidatus Desantisbacteria bacterium]
MKINKIKLHNYRQYYNEQVISIPEKGKIIIIRGENGAGKTNLISGLTWCLYNEKTNIKELINDKALDEAPAGKKVEMYIEIHFKHDDILYIIKRNISVINSLTDQLKPNEKYNLQKIKDGTIQESIDDEVASMGQGSKLLLKMIITRMLVTQLKIS